MAANLTTEDIRLAQQVQEKWGVPASLTLAQYSLESANGTSSLATTKNNYFGMRAVGGGWRTFSSKAASFDAYGELLNKSIYTNTGWKNATSVQEAITKIQPVYAPTSDGNAGYVQSIMRIINSNNLSQYDDSTKWGTTNSSASVDSSGGVTSTGIIGDTVNGWLSKIVTAIAIVFICVLAFIFFTQALDINVVGMVKEVI